jgi:hypothetical protein
MTSTNPNSKSFNTKDFNDKASTFVGKYQHERVELEKCLENKLNDDINFVCQTQKEAYLRGVAQTFCKGEYDFALKCQKESPETWASSCFKLNTDFGQCADAALRRMYIFNLEHNKKNPAAN